MPELPEVERVRSSIERAVVDLRVSAVIVHRRDVVTGPDDPPGGWGRTGETVRRSPKPRIPKQLLLEGSTITAVLRHGKQLAIAGDASAAGVHLGMTGQLLFRGPGENLDKNDHLHVTWKLRNDRDRPAGRLVFRDLRRFGGVWAHRSVQELVEQRWRSLGPDALDISAAALGDRLRPRRQSGSATRSVKAALLDQKTVAGVGNIYADEALFAAGISPQRPVNRLDPEDIRRLANELRRILRRAIKAGGSTLRDYVDGDGSSGSFQFLHKVYGRTGCLCTRCGKPLRSGQVAQRTTVWCGECQC